MSHASASAAVGAYLWRPKTRVRAPIDATMFAVCCSVCRSVFGKGAKDDDENDDSGDDDDGPKCGSIHSMAVAAYAAVAAVVNLTPSLTIFCTEFVFFFFFNKLIPPIKLFLLPLQPQLTKLSVRYLY